MFTIRLSYPRTLLIAAAAALACGCEASDRRHDYSVADVNPPTVEQLSEPKQRGERINIPDLVEEMMMTRQALLERLKILERAYLGTGDSVRADWARRQRELTNQVDVFPYLTDQPTEFVADAAPEQKIPEADKIYNEAVSLHNQVRGIPLKGVLASSKQKARQALTLFKHVLKDYPKSDKVDDCAFYCGEIYKEYLREDDPRDELSVRYYLWAVKLDPHTPHAARYQAAVVLDYRRHDRAKALELYHQVLEVETYNDPSNVRYAATRIEQLTDEELSHVRPQDDKTRPVTPIEPPPRKAGESAAPVAGTPEKEP